MKYILFNDYSKHLAVIYLKESVTTGGIRKYSGKYFSVPLLHKNETFIKL